MHCGDLQIFLQNFFSLGVIERGCVVVALPLQHTEANGDFWPFKTAPAVGMFTEELSLCGMVV